MQVFPTKPAAQLAVGGALVVLVGILSRQVAIVAWGGAIVFALAVARAWSMVSVWRIRSAGFEMLWSTEQRLMTVGRGSEVELQAEVRNRDTRAARYVHLRPVASSNLIVEVHPRVGEVPAGGRLHVKVKVKTPRVGHHAVHGLSLEVQGAPGLFEVPLTFANPFGIEVLPRAMGTLLLTARGGRSRRGAEAGRPGPLSGEGLELRELREHLPGDPFKRIAWRASAKRGKLMVREYEHDERDVVWLILDASVELWAGPPGSAPLDLGIDEIATIAKQHLARGDLVGLAILGGRLRALLEPDQGPKHAHLIALALLVATSTYDAERTELEEKDVALRVLEHLRPLDAKGVGAAGRLDIDRLAFRAEAAIARAPFNPPVPEAPSPRERALRRYLAAFGIESPARSDPERPRTDEALARLLERLAQRKPRPSMVHIWSPAPDRPRADLTQALVKLRRVGAQVCWISARQEQAVQLGTDAVAQAVRDAVVLRSRMARERGERVLAHMGVKVERMRQRPSAAQPLMANVPASGPLRPSLSPPPPPVVSDDSPES